MTTHFVSPQAPRPVALPTKGRQRLRRPPGPVRRLAIWISAWFATRRVLARTKPITPQKAGYLSDRLRDDIGLPPAPPPVTQWWEQRW